MSNYIRRKGHLMEELQKEANILKMTEEPKNWGNFCQCGKGQIYLWNILENPHTSKVVSKALEISKG